MNFTSSITLAFKDAFSSGFTQAKNSFAGMTSALSDINKNQSMNQLAAGLAMATNMTEPFRQKLSAMMDEPSRLAGTFDSSMRNIQSLTGETNGSLAELSKKLLEVGAGSTAGPNAIADAYYNITSGIGDATVRMDTLIAANNLAESGQAHLGAATSGLISVVNAYGTSAENMGGLSDVFFQTVRKGVGSLDGFVSSMSSIAGLSASVGVGFDELGSAMAFVTAKGQTEAVASTQLKAAMISFMKPTSEMQQTLQSLGISSGSAMIQEYGLAASINMLKGALGGSQDKMAKALGSTEALQAAIALTDAGYSEFAASYSAGLSDATSKGLEQQAKSYEYRVARLQAASDSLSIGIGNDINAIKGFFVDAGYGFLQHFAAPIMNSPIGGVFQAIAAGVGFAAKSILDIGSGALNTASQLVVLTATLQNAGGFAKLFSNSLSLLGAPLGAVKNLLAPLGVELKRFGYLVHVVGLKTTLLTYLRLAGQGFCDMGKSIMSTLSKIGAWITSTLAAAKTTLLTHLQLAGQGFSNMGKSIVGVLPKMGAWIASTWAAAAANIAAFWPIYAIIGGIALLTAGVILLVKNWGAVSGFFVNLWNTIKGAFATAWDWIKNIFSGLPNWVVGLLAVFFPFIAIPILIIKKWDMIKGFFISLWNDVVSVFTNVWNSVVSVFTTVWNSVVSVFTTVWNSVVSFFVTIWNYVLSFFTFVWNSIVGIVTSVANWFTGVWDTIAGGFAIAWGYVYNFFAGIWEAIKGVVLDFVNWLSPIIDIIIAPFKAIGTVIGGILNTVGGWFKDGTSELTINTDLSNTAASSIQEAAQPIVPAVPVAESSAITSPATTAVSAPTLTDNISPPSLTGTSTQSVSSGIGGITTSAARMGTSVNDYSASAAFMNSGASSSTVTQGRALDKITQAVFSEAMPQRNTSIEKNKERGETKNAVPQTIHIENVYVQNDDIQNAYDFMKQLLQAAHIPMEAAV